MNTEELEQPINRLTEAATETARRTVGEVQNHIQTVREKADQAIIRGQGYLKENPMQVALGALAIGFAAGFVMAHREPPSFRRRYIDGPLHHTQDTLYSILAPALAKLGEQYSSARSVAEDAFDKIHHESSRSVEPWLRRVSSNLKFW